jgi:D-3-phosphoglycerate dehydrogenase
LKAVGRAGVGVDNIDIDAATESWSDRYEYSRWKYHCNRGTNFYPYALRYPTVVRGVTSMSDGLWERKQLKGAELRFKTLAVLGLGRIGVEVAKRAKAFRNERNCF